MKKMWEPFGSCLQNSTSNPAHFLPNWAGLAVLFSRKLPNDFFNIFKFFTYETNETHALAFLKHIILAVGGVGHYGDEGYPIPSKDDYYQQEPSLNVGGVPLPVSSIGAIFFKALFNTF